MSNENLKPLLFRDPVSGGDLYVRELANDESGISIRGKFEIPSYAKLDAEQAKFLETFLRCRGMLNSVERELGISYPTVRSRLDALLEALDLTPVREDAPKRDRGTAERKQTILDQLERGEITAEEAKAKLREVKAK